MINEDIGTFFAPAERFEIEEVKQQAIKILASPEFKKFTDAIPDVFMILNSKRQVVYFNSRLNDLLKIEDSNSLMGMRPGEVFNCIHSKESVGGCGTTKYCEMCGAVNAILASQTGEFSIQECRILSNEGTDALDLRVWASPYQVNEQIYTIFAIQDISDEKRKSVLERIFFHDIINTAGGLKGLAELLRDSPEDINEFKDIIYSLSETLIEEIMAQKQLISAENNELAVSLIPVNSLELIKSLDSYYQNHYVTDGKYIEIDKKSESIIFISDEALVKRVVGNMLKNAIEATPMGSTVNMKCYQDNDEVCFEVHNPSVMQREVQLQMFQRSFSTKGTGRGLGTYSMKLLTQKYLKGSISFKTEEGFGTTFVAKFKIKFPN